MINQNQCTLLGFFYKIISARYVTRKSQNSQYLLMQFLYSKHIPLIEEMIAKAQEKVIETNPKDTFNMGFHAIPSMAQVKNKSTTNLPDSLAPHAFMKSLF